jgi:hypothetical protein
MDTRRLLVTCIHLSLLCHWVLDGMGNPHPRTLGFMLEATSPLHMVESDSGTNNPTTPMREEGLMEVLIHGYSNHTTIMVVWVENGSRGADNRL